MEVTRVKKKYSNFLLSIPGVTSVGTSDEGERLCIRVEDEKTMQILQGMIVRQIEGVLVEFMVMSQLKPQGEEKR